MQPAVSAGSTAAVALLKIGNQIDDIVKAPLVSGLGVQPSLVIYDSYSHILHLSPNHTSLNIL